MTDHRARYGPHNPDETYVAHAIAEQLVDLGEIEMNYATVGDAASPALLLIPGQTESWWGYEAAMPLLAEHFQVFAVDLRGQGRSTRTPGRYTLDNMGNDLVRFIDLVIGRPTIVSGLSSGGVLSAWLSAYAKPGQVARRALRGPAAVRVGGPAGRRPRHPPVHRPDVRPLEHLPRRPVVDRGVGRDARGIARDSTAGALRFIPVPDEPPQNLKEYDPEWGRSFWTGTVGAVVRPRADAAQRQGPRCCSRTTCASPTRPPASCSVRCPTSRPSGCRTSSPARASTCEYRSFPDVGHSMHGDRARPLRRHPASTGSRASTA